MYDGYPMIPCILTFCYVISIQSWENLNGSRNLKKNNTIKIKVSLFIKQLVIFFFSSLNVDMIIFSNVNYEII